MNELLEILQDVCPDVEFEGCQSLIDDKILSSFDVLSIISELNDSYGIKIGAGEIVPDNFNSVDAIWAMIQRLRG